MLWFFIYLIPGRIGIYKFWFMRRGENWSTRKKPLAEKERTNNKLNPQMASLYTGERSLFSPLSNSVTSCTKIQK